MTTRPISDAPDLAELERRAAAHAPEYGKDAHIVCDNLVRIYQTEGVEVIALQGLDLLVGEGEMVALVGASGSGKSTLAEHPRRSGRADRRGGARRRGGPARHVGPRAAAVPP